MGRKKKEPSLSETLRDEIRKCGETLYRVAKDSGVAYATLHRFMAGKRTIGSPAIDKLCAYLGLRLAR